MDRSTFENWLDAHKRAWESRNPEAAVELDGIFPVKLDADGNCTEVRAWWHKKE